MVDLFRYRKWDLVSKRGLYYLISALMLLTGIIAIFSNVSRLGPGNWLNFGIDFKGGGLVSYRVDAKLPADKTDHIIGEIRTQLKEMGIEDSEVQISPGAVEDTGDIILIRTLLPKDVKPNELDMVLAEQITTKITPAIAKTIAASVPSAAKITREESREVVTGTVSRELINNSALALVLGSLLIMLWIGIRYNIGGFGMRYAVAGIIALAHDLLTLVGMFALFHNVLEVNSPFIAALLTVLGYSIHDTIVIFDRIRENMRLRKGRTFAETVNISLLETMARSVNTVLTVLITLLALFFFGGPTLRDFVAAMLIGVTIGAYSSIFVASQLLVSWSKGRDREMLPIDAVAPAAVEITAPQPVAVAAGNAVTIPTMPVQPTAPASKDAVQRARQAGKTSKRRR